MQSGRWSVARSVQGFFAEFIEMKRHFRYHKFMHLDCAKQQCKYCQENAKHSVDAKIDSPKEKIQS